MFTRRDGFWLAILPLALPIALVARKEWRDGRLEAVEIKDFETGKHHVDHRYVCTVADGDLLYYVEYEKPLKVAVHDPVKFIIDKDDLIILDSDNKERKAKIEKRERAAK
jgi:hypothetical protein